MNVTLDAFAWTMVERRIDPESVLAHKIDLACYGCTGSELVTIDLTEDEEALFNSLTITKALRQLFAKEQA